MRCGVFIRAASDTRNNYEIQAKLFKEGEERYKREREK
jgi:hypothetical protein